MIWNKQFKYPNSQRSIKGEYDINKALLPSVTTVLNATQPEEKRKSLDKWIARTGEDEATRIKELAGRRGTAMHFYLQKHLDPDCKGYMDLTTLGQVAEPMAKKIIEKGLEDLTEVWGSEVTVYYPGLYAGLLTSQESMTFQKVSSTLNNPTNRNEASGLETISCSSGPMPWRIIMSMEPRSIRVLS